MNRRLMLVLVLALVASACSDSRTVTPRAEPEPAPPAYVLEDLVPVPAGWFSAGCFRVPADPVRDQPRTVNGLSLSEYRRLEDCVLADPPRHVYLSSFEIDRFPTTVENYAGCVARGKCVADAKHAGHPKRPIMATLEQAEAVCRSRNARLPTAAEWLKAARGTDGRIFPWGDSIPSWCSWETPFSYLRLDCDRDVSRVGLHPEEQSPYGVEDLVGVVPQWVSDSYAVPAVPGPDRLRSTIEPGGTMVAYDWSSTRFKWAPDASIVDPQGPQLTASSYFAGRIVPISEPSGRGTRNPYRDASITGVDSPDYEKENGIRVWRAGVRCVRAAPSPPAPTVPRDAYPPDKFVLPYLVKDLATAK